MEHLNICCHDCQIVRAGLVARNSLTCFLKPCRSFACRWSASCMRSVRIIATSHDVTLKIDLRCWNKGHGCCVWPRCILHPSYFQQEIRHSLSRQCFASIFVSIWLSRFHVRGWQFTRFPWLFFRSTRGRMHQRILKPHQPPKEVKQPQMVDGCWWENPNNWWLKQLGFL